MFRSIKRLAIVAAVMASMIVVPMEAAYAADGCGDDWYKGSDGYLEKDEPWQGAGSHNAWLYHSGRVRFCTQDDFIGDDDNRRALIGYPSDSYPFESQIMKNGTYTKFCVRQTIKANITGVKSSESWTISGSVSKGDPSVSASYSATYDTLTVTVAKTATCSTSASQIIARTSGITVTGTSDDSAEVQWVELTTQLTMEYWVNGTKYVQNHSMTEKDYS
ncbi:hypothetical protein [Streptomyces sp. SID13031]|uniref:hypothetical protein n=1 Tax=Streptomyces sp. SID13031 TaxID=2706046 RepID=UPI0013C6CE73|nr:hypothetical protein [Streptomyces sp. SID13031]NEA34979.1 hypothetical protein [Streptomyces sp. SID13031]